MDLTAIRHGITAVLEQLPHCRVVGTIPDSLPATGQTIVVVAPSDPYVSYSEGAGLVQRNEVNMRVIVVPPQQSGATRILEEIDQFLSCGADQPRSVRSLLGDNISANGTACSVSVLTASIRTIDINDLTAVVGEIDLRILARC